MTEADSAQVSADRWIDALPPELRVQARLLRGLLNAVKADPRWDALELGCSLAAGRADADSDLDVGLWHLAGARPRQEEVDALVRSLGEVIEVSAQPWDGVPRWWVQYADGAQLDLVLLDAADRMGRAPGAVVLLDRSGRGAARFVPTALRAAPEQPRAWLLDGWEALSNVAKYLRRGSLLEAVDQLHRARHRLFQLWAVGKGVEYPGFGLTSLLDAEDAPLPPGIEATYPVIDPASVASAATALARLLPTAGHLAQPGLATPLANYVSAKFCRAQFHPVPDGGPLPAVELVAVDEEVLDQLVSVAVTDASAGEVTPPLTAGGSWSAERVDWLRRFHRDRRDGLAGPRREATWAVLVDGTVAGAVRLAETPASGVVETGIWLSRSARGGGTAARALASVIDAARARGYAELRAETTADNRPARALLAAAGFAPSPPDADGVLVARLGLAGTARDDDGPG